MAAAYRLPRKYRYRGRGKGDSKGPLVVVAVAAALMAASGTKGVSAITHHGAAAAGSATVVYTSQGANEDLGNRMAASYGWTGQQETCLDELWERESGWQSDIANQQSGAFGIAQALGHGGSGTAVTDSVVRYPGGGSASDVTVNEYPSSAANGGNAAAEIRWGLGYINQTYGSPCGAWGHETSDGWY